MTVKKVMDWDAMAETDRYARTTRTQVVWEDGDRELLRMSKTKASLVFAAREILSEENPMTVRQVYYQLFSQGWVDNSQASYKQVVGALVDGRQSGLIPWEHVEDRTRQPREVAQWADLGTFLSRVKNSYRRDVWQDQPTYLEVWLEKDALSGIFQDELREWGVTLNVGKGYDGWASIQEASERFREASERGQNLMVLYAGDYDPSGLHMEQSLRERLAYFGIRPEWDRLAVDREDIDEHDLPPEPGKRSDSRAEWMVDHFGELIQVELDALPVNVLRAKINDGVREHMDVAALEETREAQGTEREDLAEIIDAFQGEDA